VTDGARRRDERGSALVELTWLGLLLLVPMLWILLSVFEVQQGAFGVSSAARSAGRAYALAPNDAVGHARAEAAVRVALDDQGLEGVPFTLRVTCEPLPANCHSGTSVGMPRRSRWTRRTRCRSASTRRSTVPHPDERGQATVLIVGLATVLAMTIALVVDATAAYLQRQGLNTLADGAALRGADLGATGRDVYEGGVPTERLELTAAQARQAVGDYLRGTGAFARYPGLSYRVRIDPAAQRIEVSLTAPLDLPLTIPGSPEQATIGATGAAVVGIDAD
jgi:Flp pilus assembly protein TadG